MKKIILSLSIVAGILLMIIVFFKQKSVRETSPIINKPINTPVQKETITSIWLKPTSSDKFILIADAAGETYDTLQLAFKAGQNLVQDFTPPFSSDFILRVKKIEEGDIILLFSTNGELQTLTPKQPLGELSLMAEANLSDLIFDQSRTKIIKRGQEFPVNFLGIKNE